MKYEDNIVGEKVVMFDIFISNDLLYIIAPYTEDYHDDYNNEVFIEDEIVLFKVYVKEEQLKLCKSYTNKGKENFTILIFNCVYSNNDNQIEVRVNYNDKLDKNFIVENSKIEKKHYLSLTTCFKYDYKLFDLWYEYYKKQGVDHFYMYYNGKLTQEIVDIFDKNDVTLIEWDFNYWVYTKIRRHFAQIGQIQHSLYKYGKINSEYMIYCDLDEYFHINNSTIKETIKNKIVDHLYFLNIWCKTLDGRIPRSFPENFYCNIKPDKYPIRSKNIYKTSMFNYLFIHCPNLNNYPRFRNKYNKSIINNKRIGYLGGILFHFGNWFGRKRPLCDRQSKYPRDKDKIIKLLGLQK